MHQEADMLAKRFSYVVIFVALISGGCNNTNLTPIIESQNTQTFDSSSTVESQQNDQNSSPPKVIEVPKDIPITPDGYDFVNFYDGSLNPEFYDVNCTYFFYRTKIAEEDLGEYYKNEMKKNGWDLAKEEIGETKSFLNGTWQDTGAEQYSYYFEKPGRRVGIFFATPQASYMKRDNIQIHINFSDWYIIHCIKIPDDVPTIGEFRGIVNNSFDIGYGDSSTTGTSFDYRTARSLEEVVNFYRSEMPQKGWTLISESAAGEVSMLEYQKIGRQSPSPEIMYRENVIIQIYPDLWGGTEVQMRFID